MDYHQTRLYIAIPFLAVLSVITALEMSEGVVFKPGETLTLYCWFRDSEPPPDIKFIWHHNHTRLDLADLKPNLPDEDNEKFIYELYTSKAGMNKSGYYSCKRHDRPESVSTTVTAVLVDDSPVVAEMSKPTSFNILNQSGDNILCFTADDKLSEIPDCVYDIQSVGASDIGDHTTVIASVKAFRHYKTIQNAMDLKVTFNTTKPLLGLQIKKESENVSFTLIGTGQALVDTKVDCLDKQGNMTEVHEIDPGVEDQRVFICLRPRAKAEITVKIKLKGLVIFDKLVTAAAIRTEFNYLSFYFGFVVYRFYR